MQYILTQAEYDALRNKQQQSIKLSREKLQKLCTKIAITMPIVCTWGDKTPQPWGCPLDRDEDGYQSMEYCDQCPVQEICPNEYMEWSK